MVLRLIPLLTCMNIFHLEFWRKNHLVMHLTNCSLSYMNFLQFSSVYFQFYPCALAFLGLPVYYFPIFPFFRKYVFTIIRRIGPGLLLMTMVNPLCAIVDLVQVTLSHTSADTVCIIDSTVAGGCPTSYQLLAIAFSELLKSIGAIIGIWGMIELIIARSSHEIKGLTVSITTTIGGAFAIVSLAVNKILSSFPLHFFPSCIFYHHVIYAMIGLLSFVLYILVARWYKLRIRDDTVPYHMIAEDFFEKEIARRHAFTQEEDSECNEEISHKQSAREAEHNS